MGQQVWGLGGQRWGHVTAAGSAAEGWGGRKGEPVQGRRQRGERRRRRW